MARAKRDPTLVDVVFPEEVDPLTFEVPVAVLFALLVVATLDRGPARDPLIASASVSVPYEVAMTAVAGLVVAVTVVRRMAVVNSLADAERVLGLTIAPLEFLLVVAAVHLATVVVGYLARALDLAVGLAVPAAALLAGTSLLLIALQERAFHNYLVWWGCVFYVYGKAAAREASAGRSRELRVLLRAVANVLLEVAYLLLRRGVDLRRAPSLEELREFVGLVEGRDGRGQGGAAVRAVVAVVAGLAAVLVAVAFALSLVFGGFARTLAVTVAVWLVAHYLGFVYLAYGSGARSRVLRGTSHSVTFVALTAAAVLWAFF